MKGGCRLYSSVEIGDVREVLGSFALALEMSPSLPKQQPPAPYVLGFFEFGVIPNSEYVLKLHHLRSLQK